MIESRASDRANDLTRTYSVPTCRTWDFAIHPNGYGTLDLTTLDLRLGKRGYYATASQQLGFDPTGVVRLDVDFSESAGLDNWYLQPVPVPGAVLLGAPGLGMVGLAKRRFGEPPSGKFTDPFGAALGAGARANCTPMRYPRIPSVQCVTSAASQTPGLPDVYSRT